MTDKNKMPEQLTKSKKATHHTQKTNAAILNQLPFADQRSFENAAKGFIATMDEVMISRPNDGKITLSIGHINGLSRVDILADCADRTCRPVQVSIY